MADEVFMTGTAAEVKSVTEIDQITIGKGRLGTKTRELQKSFMNVVMGKDDSILIMAQIHLELGFLHLKLQNT